MKREEAAKLLENDLCGDDDCPHDEAWKMGADALRSIAPLEEKMVALIEERDALQKRLDELERWAKAWVDYHDKRGTISTRHGNEDMLAALNGSMTWPEKEKPC